MPSWIRDLVNHQTRSEMGDCFGRRPAPSCANLMGGADRHLARGECKIMKLGQIQPGVGVEEQQLRRSRSGHNWAARGEYE